MKKNNAAYVILNDDVEFDRIEGIEYPVYHLSLMDDEDQEIKTYTSRDFEYMYNLGDKIAEDRKIEFVPNCTKLF